MITIDIGNPHRLETKYKNSVRREIQTNWLKKIVLFV